MTDDQVERVRALVAAIPTGRIATYGDIATAAELSSPRIVGWIMRTDSSDLPWHRVITASGRPARHLAARQLELLRAEGVLAVDGRVPLTAIRYELPGAPADDAGSGAGGRRKRAPTRKQGPPGRQH